MLVKRLELTNFMRHDSTVLEFPERGVVLITGIYLLLFYRIGAPYASVARITDELRRAYPLGTLAGHVLGHVNVDNKGVLSFPPDVLAALVRETYKLDCQLDLVAVARVLPETLRIREGTEITSGDIRLAVASSSQEGEPAWSGQLAASRLGAKADGRALAWENPLTVDFAMRQTTNGMIIDRADCTSSFLHATAAGSLENLTATANFDLSPQGLGITQPVIANECRQVGVIVDGKDEALDTVPAAVESQPGAVFSKLGQALGVVAVTHLLRVDIDTERDPDTPVSGFVQ